MIAERRRVENHLKTILDATSDAVIIVDTDWMILAASQSAAQRHGRRIEHMVGCASMEVFHPDSLERKKRWAEKAVRSQKMVQFQEENGGLKSHTRIFPISDENNNVFRLAIWERDDGASPGRETADLTAAEYPKESEKLLKSILDHSPLLIFVKDTDGRYLLISKQLENQFDITVREMIGKAPREIYPRAIADEIQTHDGEVLGCGKVCRFVESMELNGKKRTYISIKHPLFNKTGHPYAICGIAIEIPESRRTSRLISESESRFHRVVENMPIMVDATNEMGVFVFWNRACEKVTGYSADEIVGNPDAFELLCPDPFYRKRMLEDWKHHRTDYRNREWEIACKGGQKKIVEWTDLSADCPISGWSAWRIGIDVTERRLAEKKLRESEERYASFVRNFQGIAFRIDMSLKPIFLHGAVSGITGYSESAFLSGDMAWADIVFPADWTAVVKQAMDEIRHGKAYADDIAYRIVHANGDVRWVRTIFHTVSKPGEAAGWIQGAIYDITDSKRKEAKLREREQELKKRKEELEEMNAALRVFLDHRNTSRREMEENILANVRELAMPCLEKLKDCGSRRKAAVYIDMLETKLNDIVSPFINNIRSSYLNLSPMEIRVADLVKEGRRTKEIAEVFNLSPRTVEAYRNSVRAKLGIANKKINLRAHLMKIDNHDK